MVRRAPDAELHADHQEDEQTEEQDRADEQPVDVREGEDVERPVFDDAVPQQSRGQGDQRRQAPQPAASRLLALLTDVSHIGVHHGVAGDAGELVAAVRARQFRCLGPSPLLVDRRLVWVIHEIFPTSDSHPRVIAS